MPLSLPSRTLFPTAHLPLAEDFRFVGEETALMDRISLSHKRAKSIAMAYKPDIDDILHCSEKFWNMHLDPINGFDGASVTLWTLQTNLGGGTLAAFVKDRPDLQVLWKSVINFEITLHYMLTEVGHGLDAVNIKTVAEYIPDTGFDLHTPHDQAAKFMPASIPSGNLPRVAIVMARLKVHGKDLGVRAFVVALNDGHKMCSGITSRPLPSRLGSKPLGHAITTFNHVKLPLGSLLGDMVPASNPRIQFLSEIWRIGIGSICLTAVIIPALRLSAYITAEYSKRRKVTMSQGQVVPIISFRTQQAPVIIALVQAIVLEAFYKEIRQHFINGRDISTLNYRNAISTVFKVISVGHWRLSSLALADRCGAQGLFDFNQIIAMQMEIRGVTIAEGDIQVLSIRLASELLLNRYNMAPQKYPDSFLAQHEKGMLSSLQTVLNSIRGEHRSETFNRKIIPRSIALAEAIGHRMAFEAALDAGVDPLILKLYETSVVLHDIAWYSEHGLCTQDGMLETEEHAITDLYKCLDQLLDHSGVQPYAYAAITTEKSWKAFVRTLPVYAGNAHTDPLNPLNQTRARL